MTVEPDPVPQTESDDEQHHPWVVSLVVVAASVVLGGATAYAQGFLPDALESFANSSSGWTILTALLVWWARVRPLPSAVLGAASFVALTVGYALASDLRGLYYDPVFFSVIGVVVGPFVGVAACWLRREGMRAALGAGLLAGICLGEAVYGWTVVGDTTSPVYWSLVAVLGVVLLVAVLVTRPVRTVERLVGVGFAAAVAAAFLVVYSAF